MSTYFNEVNPAHLADGPENNIKVPVNLEAERAVLGSCLIDPEAISKVPFLKPGDFYRERHQWVYEAMMALNERRMPIDFVTLSDELERHGRLEDTGSSFVTDLITEVPTALYVEHYGHIVERTSALRRLISVAGKIAELAYQDGDDVGAIIDRAEQMVMSIGEGRLRQSVLPVSTIIPDVIDRVESLAENRSQLMGVPTGFTYLDNMLGGLQKSDLIILAGRPGMGKSGFALSVAQNAAKQFGSRVAIVSLEMSDEQLVQRMLSMETGINSHRLRLGKVEEDEWPILLEAANMLMGTNIYIDASSGGGLNELRSKARRLHAEQGLDLLVIDYMQLITVDGHNQNNRQQEVSQISRSLKSLARELNIPILALSQLSRSVETRADKRPMLSDLRESGSIEQDADVVLFLYREDYYIEDTDRQNVADVIVAKHRHGATGSVSLYFRKELTQFRDMQIERTGLEY